MIEFHNEPNDEGNITGGYVDGPGLRIDWQEGPIVDGQQTGSLLADVLEGCRQRLEAYQNTSLRCRENALAITKIEEAMHWLDHRQKDREDRGVINTYSP